MKTLSIETLRVHRACDLAHRVRDLQTVLSRVVPEDEEVPLEAWFGLDSTSLGDALWAACIVLGRTDVAVEVARLAATRTGCPRAADAACTAATISAARAARAAVAPVAADAACTAATISAARAARAARAAADDAADAELAAQWADLYRLLDLGAK